MAVGSDMQDMSVSGVVVDKKRTMVKYGSNPKQAFIAARDNGALMAGRNDR
jgi:hypothetical protein